MPPKITSTEDQEKLRKRIIDAARTLFVERGIEAVSMREIARNIHYSATTIYNHFTDKEALLQAVCDEDFLELAVSMRQVMQLPNTVVRIQALCHGYVQFALSHPNHYRLMFMTPRASCNLDITKIPQGNIEQDAYAQLLWVVKEAFAAGLFRSDINDYALIAQTLWASIHGVCSLEIALSHDIWIQWQPIAARIELMQNAILTGLLRHPEQLETKEKTPCTD